MYRQRRRKRRSWRGAALFAAVIAVIILTVYGSVKLITLSNGSGDSINSDVSAQALDPADENEYVEKIRAAYSRSDAIENIIEHIDMYSTTLLDALLAKPEMVEFVEGYITHKQYGFENADNIDISGEYTPGEIPLFIQWDKRWGYETYGTDLMALNACGPTCMAMIYVGLTGDTSENPLSIAEMSIKNHYYYDYQGTSTELITDGAGKLGLHYSQLSASSEAVLGSLRAGRPVMVNVGPGDFTSYGHYIVLTGIDENGKIKVNDPNSPIKSSKVWDVDRIVEQSFTIWSIWK